MEDHLSVWTGGDFEVWVAYGRFLATVWAMILKKRKKSYMQNHVHPPMPKCAPHTFALLRSSIVCALFGICGPRRL